MGCTPQYEQAGSQYLYRNPDFASVNRSWHRGVAQAHNLAVTGDEYAAEDVLCYDQNY